MRLGAGLYLLAARPVYRATARVWVQENAPKASGDAAGYAPATDGYAQNQADVFQSQPVLSRALEAVEYPSLKTFSALPATRSRG